MSANLTLYSIETDLLNLMLCRESLVDDPDMLPSDIEEAVKQVDLAIRERVAAEVKKVDGIAFYLREFATRAETAKAEAKRLRDRVDAWQRRYDRLEEITKSVMLMTGKTRLDGEQNTLRLQKCPPSVEIAQLELVPDEYVKTSKTLDCDTWAQIHDALPLELRKKLVKGTLGPMEPSKSKIGEALKRGDGVPGARLVVDKMSLRVE